jgi:hypothetical protein
MVTYSYFAAQEAASGNYPDALAIGAEEGYRVTWEM